METDECVARWRADARFIASARTALPLALKALRGEVERHELEPEWRDEEDIRRGYSRDCISCGDRKWPCNDLRRLHAAIIGGSNE